MSDSRNREDSEEGKVSDVYKKKVDPRVRTLIENNIKKHHRSFFIIVGDKAKNHHLTDPHSKVTTLYTIMTKLEVKSRPSILWCYKKDLGFTSHRQKREKKIKQKARKGLAANDEEDPFERFITTSEIRYTYYKDTHKILGNTFGMCVLQDFEAITPNVLARTIETVEGGGVVVILLEKLTSLKQLYSLSMDSHNHYKTENAREVAPRFNERFILSLSNCESCLVIDDELNILPITASMQQITPLNIKKLKEESTELAQLKQSLSDNETLQNIVAQTRTIDQARAVLTFVDAISEKTLRTTVSLTAGRGRGKSAALGLAIASAVSLGYSNIFVTSPSPENLKTLFEFIFKGLDALNFKEHTDYELVQSTNPAFNKAIVRINIYKFHRQTIQYIDPHDSQKLGQTELLVIDEAAAIPLPVVRSLLGPYLVFLSSTINGYEGTGRSLSLKLISQLREQSSKSNNSRVLQEVDLKEPVRYGPGDPVEKWLSDLLCLDATNIPKIGSGFPHPKDCELYYVNRDTLFSYHKASESFLQRLVALFVSSHYKNSPNDLMLMSDAPSHHIFVLLGPVDPSKKTLPEILCAVQIGLEGKISTGKVSSVLGGGADRTPDGDLIPWTLSQQFQETGFANLLGGRVVRISTNPDYQKMGYGGRALELLSQYYQGLIMDVSEEEDGEEEETSKKQQNDDDDTIKPRKGLPPLLVELKDRKPERLHYLGVSFGVTSSLYSFWKKAGYLPMYVRQTANDLTGEHTCIMLKSLKADDLEVSAENWVATFTKDFNKRFITLLSSAFRGFAVTTSLNILDPKRDQKEEKVDVFDKTQLDREFTPYDLKRLDSYSRNLLDFHVIMDLLPQIATLFFLQKLPAITLSAAQCAILLGMGLQRKSLEETANELTLPYEQIRALFNKCMRRISQYFREVNERAIEEELPYQPKPKELNPLREDLEEELKEGRMSISEGATLVPTNEIEKALKDQNGKEPSILRVKTDKKRKSIDEGKIKQKSKMKFKKNK